MLIVAGTFTVDPARRAEFLQSRVDAIRTSRREQGCMEYAMSADAVDPSRVRVFEIWSSHEDLPPAARAIIGVFRRGRAGARE